MSPRLTGRPTGRPAGSQYPFRAWRGRLGITIPEAAKLLGREDRVVHSYDKQAEMSQMLELAMAALEHLPAWHLRALGIEPYWRR